MRQHHDDDELLEEDEHDHGGGFVTGALLGGLVGVGVGLLLAPASGLDTRHRLRDKAVAARDEAMHKAEEARAKAEDLQASGREMLEENKRRIVRTAEAVKQSAQEAWTGEGPDGGAPQTPAKIGEGGYGDMARSSTGSAGPTTGPYASRS